MTTPGDTSVSGRRPICAIAWDPTYPTAGFSPTIEKPTAALAAAAATIPTRP
jgi:hypothetical protein